MTLLSRLLVDEQFRGLIEKYGDEVVTRMAQASYTPGNDNGHAAANRTAPRTEPRVDEPAAKTTDLTDLQDRVLAMEAQQTLFELLRSKIRPLALALGCCPECLVGVDLCPRCWGQSKVAHYPPDHALLEAQVVRPLAARGVPLVLRQRTVSSAAKSTGVRRRRRPWPKK
jgi:hypothetical protein